MESTQPVSPTSVPSKRKHDDCYDDQRPKSLESDHEDDNLCDLCETVDFLAFFTSRCKTVSLGPLSHVFDCLRCPFCKYIAGIVHQKHGHLALSRKGQVVFIQRFLPNEEYIRESGIELLFRLEVWTKRSNRSRLLLTTIEACDGLPEPSYPNVRMIRVPIQARFEPSLLNQWLANAGPANAGVENPQLLTAAHSAKALRDRRKFRVLDVYSGKVLVLGSAQRYLALSYVWGQYAGSKGRAVRVSPQYDNEDVAWTIDLNAQPATIRDAALLVRELGERFLWVDTLCIDQDDALDKAEIVSKMDVIYQHAYLTIVAADGDNANGGLRRLHSHETYPEQPVRIRNRERRLSFLPKLPEYHSTLQQTTWNTRGWTYQEMVLSPCSVVFTEDQVFFSAMGRREQESYKIGNKIGNEIGIDLDRGGRRKRATNMTRTTQESLRVVRTTPRDRMMAYRTAIEEYTKRTFTYEGDRLDAFYGITSFIGKSSISPQKIQALSGVLMVDDWAREFEQVFDWYSSEPSHRIPHNKLRTRALPSWSWIGWSGAVRFGANSVFYELVMLNDNNIRLNATSDLQGAEWPYEPAPCTLTPQEGIVLHLWAPYLRCMLRRTTPKDAGLKNWRRSDIHHPYSVTMVPDDGQQRKIIIALDPSLIPPAGTDGLYEFVGAGPPYRDDWGWPLMLVKRCDNPEFVERVGVSFGRLIVRPGHPQEFRHIKLL